MLISAISAEYQNSVEKCSLRSFRPQIYFSLVQCAACLVTEYVLLRSSVANTAALRLPAQGSLVVDLSEAQDILRLAGGLGCEEASGSSEQINGSLNGPQVLADRI